MFQNEEIDPTAGHVLGDAEGWLLDWLTAAQLPRFNGKGTLRVVREVGLGAWLLGFPPDVWKTHSGAPAAAMLDWHWRICRGIREDSTPMMKAALP